MGLEVKDVRKTVVVGWDTNVVQGNHASISAAGAADEALAEKKQVDNDGEAPLAYPWDFEGDSYVVIRGSQEGEIEGTIKVTADGAEVAEGGSE